MQQPLPAQASLDQLKKQVKELVKNHRNRRADAFALIREFLPSLTGKTDEEVSLYPFALHDAQSVIARQYGFPGWIALRNQLQSTLTTSDPEAAVGAKFRIVCLAYEQDDYAAFCSVLNESMRTAVPKENFDSAGRNLAVYLKAAYQTRYMGEMMDGEHTVHFWRLSAPSVKRDLLVRMAVKDDLVSGILFTVPFGGQGAKP